MPDVIPLLACDDIAAEHDFLVEVLGFSPVTVDRLPDGSAVHGEVRIGERRIWLHRADDNLQPPHRSGPSGGIVVHVPDVDRHCDRARQAGAEIVSEPRDEDYGQREYGVRDPEGHVWWFATPSAPPAAR